MVIEPCYRSICRFFFAKFKSLIELVCSYVMTGAEEIIENSDELLIWAKETLSVWKDQD
jgi:hypothetical protein